MPCRFEILEEMYRFQYTHSAGMWGPLSSYQEGHPGCCRRGSEGDGVKWGIREGSNLLRLQGHA